MAPSDNGQLRTRWSTCYTTGTSPSTRASLFARFSLISPKHSTMLTTACWSPSLLVWVCLTSLCGGWPPFCKSDDSAWRLVTSCQTGNPERGHLVSWPRVVGVWPNQGLLLFIMFSMFRCLGLLSCVFFCVVWFCLLSWYLSCRRRVSLQRPDWRVIYCNGLLYIFPTRNIVNFLINFTFLTATYLSKARYSLLCWKCR